MVNSKTADKIKCEIRITIKNDLVPELVNAQTKRSVPSLHVGRCFKQVHNYIGNGQQIFSQKIKHISKDLQYDVHSSYDLKTKRSIEMQLN